MLTSSTKACIAAAAAEVLAGDERRLRQAEAATRCRDLDGFAGIIRSLLAHLPSCRAHAWVQDTKVCAGFHFAAAATDE